MIACWLYSTVLKGSTQYHSTGDTYNWEHSKVTLIPFNNWNCGKLNKRCKTANMLVMCPHPTKHTYLELWRDWQSFLSSPKGR